jgi:hypothetical protein
MIQKIRSYLLDNKENKESIGWYVAIIMLVPLFSYFFISKSVKKNSIGKVNRQEINAAIFNLKLYQQSMLLETIYKQLGKKEADYLVSLFFQGRSPEEFVLMDAIRQAYLSDFFHRYISLSLIAKKKVFYDSLNDENAFKQTIGEIFFNIVRKKVDEKIGANLDRFISMREVDDYVQEVYQNNLISMIFQSFIGGIEKKIFTYYVVPKKLELLTYTFDKKKNGEIYKKLIDTSIIEDEQLKSFYETGLHAGSYKKNKIFNFSFIKYGVKENQKKDFFKNANKEERKKLLEKKLSELFSLEKARDAKTFESILEKNFLRKGGSSEVRLELVGKEKKSSVVLPDAVLDFVSSSPVSENFIVVDDVIYFISNIDFKEPENLSFEEARSLVLGNLVQERVNDLIEEKVTSMRYELEEKGIIAEKDSWLEDRLYFDVIAVKKKSELDFSSQLILKKINSGGLRQGSTFSINEGDKVTVFYVCSDIVVDEARPELFSKRENALSYGFFFENLLQAAKIDIYENNSEKKDNIVEGEA